MKTSHFVKITGVFVLVKCIQFMILCYTPDQFDTSSQLILNKEAIIIQRTRFISKYSNIPSFILVPFLDRILPKLVTWDAVYFTDLFVNTMKYEHLFVFCPLWWRLVKYLPIGNDPDTIFYSKVILGVALTNVFHYISCLLLYILTNLVFKSNTLASRTKNGSLALKTSLAYVLSPAGIFLTAPYSESLCAMLSFMAFYLREVSFDRDNKVVISLKSNVFFTVTYFLSGLCVAVAYGVRANAMLLGFLYLYDLYTFVQAKCSRASTIAILTGGQLFIAIVISTYYPYHVFCPNRGEWCNSYLPSLFSYAQKHYWRIGFLSYWTPNNIPNFIFALPTIALLLASRSYFKYDFPCLNIYPIVHVGELLIIGGVFFWHVQILTRIASFLPLIYWYIANRIISAETSRDSQVKNISKYTLQYMVLWIFIQTAMFGAFLPPA